MIALPHVTIIVLNWNGRSYLEACLTALSNLDYPQFAVLLVDNASSDDSLAFVRQHFPQVSIMRSYRNLGYAGGNNRALRQIQSEFAVLVNPDIVVNPNWLQELISPMVSDPTIAIAGCKLYFPGGKLIQHAGGIITQPRAMPDHRGLHQIDQGQYDKFSDVDYVTGAALAIRRSALPSIGFLDEGFFMYFEEADFCARARAAGYRVVYVPQATAVHDESAFAVRGSDAYLERFHTGRWRYLLKHFPPQDIIAATFPAEQEWLADLQGAERWAVNRAYRTTLAGLDQLFKVRMIDGGSAVDEEQQSLIRENLKRLRRTASENPHFQQQLAELEAQGTIQEQSFTSNSPLFGPLIARIRSLWAAVAVRETVSEIITQQNAFNEQLLQELRAAEKQLSLAAADRLAKDDNLGNIKQQHLEIDAQLARTYQILASIQARLERLERQAGLDSITNGSGKPI